MFIFLKENFNQLFIKIGEHIFISSVALILGIIVAVPLGIVIT